MKPSSARLQQQINFIVEINNFLFLRRNPASNLAVFWPPLDDRGYDTNAERSQQSKAQE